jgi:hypothetical protein
MESAMNAIAATSTRKIDEVMVPCVAFVLFVIMKRGVALPFLMRHLCVS